MKKSVKFLSMVDISDVDVLPKFTQEKTKRGVLNSRISYKNRLSARHLALMKDVTEMAGEFVRCYMDAPTRKKIFGAICSKRPDKVLSIISKLDFSYIVIDSIIEEYLKSNDIISPKNLLTNDTVQEIIVLRKL